MIILSEITDSVVQPNGTIAVTETHTYANGDIQLHSYIASPLVDLLAAAQARASKINAKIQEAEDQLLAESGYEVPITVRKFLDLLGLENRLTIKTAMEANPVLKDAYDYLMAGQQVFKGPATQWLQGLVSGGLLTQAQIELILNGWPTHGE